jgi:hypothetical protein
MPPVSDGTALPSTTDRVAPSELIGVLRSTGSYRLIAVRPIAAGTRLFSIEGQRTHRPTRYSVQIEENLHIDLVGGDNHEEILDRYYWRYTNHSCEPNTVIRGQEAIAARDIEPWMDVTFNYNTTEFEIAEPFACACGSSSCSGVIRGFKHLSPEQRQDLKPLRTPYLARLLGSSRVV